MVQYCGIGVWRGLYGGGWTGCIANPLHSSEKVAPSSGVGSGPFSLSMVSAASRFSSRATPWASPRVPPALSLRGIWRQVLRGPASREEEREEIFPSLVCPAADEGGSTEVSMTGCVPPTVAARSGEVVSLSLDRDRVSMPQPILNRLGLSCPKLT